MGVAGASAVIAPPNGTQWRLIKVGIAIFSRILRILSTKFTNGFVPGAQQGLLKQNQKVWKLRIIKTIKT